MKRITFFSLKLLLLVAAFCCLLGSSLRADESPAPVTDPAQVDQHYRQVVARPEFHETAEPDAGTRMEEWLSQWFKRLGAGIGDFTNASHMPALESLLMTLLVGFSIAALVYIMFRLTRRGGGMELDRDAGMSEEKFFRPPEFYDAEIQNAIRSRDWHTAWLVSWRQFLSRLEHRHLVEPDRTRTNREYLAQLRAQPLPSSAQTLLAGMVDAYDQFIYGRKSIGESEWTFFHHQIDETALLLHLDNRPAIARAQPGAS